MGMGHCRLPANSSSSGLRQGPTFESSMPDAMVEECGLYTFDARVRPIDW